MNIQPKQSFTVTAASCKAINIVVNIQQQIDGELGEESCKAINIVVNIQRTETEGKSPEAVKLLIL